MKKNLTVLFCDSFYKKCSKCLLLAIIIVLMPLSLKSQLNFIDDGSLLFENVDGFDITLVQKFIPGVDFIFTIPLKEEDQRAELNFTGWGGDPCGVPDVPGIIGVNGSFKIQGTGCTIPAGTTQLTVNVTVDAGGADSDPVTFYINIGRKPAKIALVLDISGSMGGLAYNPADPTPDTRWEVLKSAVKNFTEFYESLYQADGDEGCLTYFTTDTINPRPSVINGIVPIYPDDHSDPAEKFSSKVNLDMGPPRHPLNLTAMGKGLIAGKNKLAPGSDQKMKSVILFTDGLQNVYPRVLSDNGNTLEDPALFLNDPGTTDPVKYFPIGIMAGEEAPLVLNSIAVASSGEVALTNDIMADWQSKFEDIFIKMTSSGSPEIVLREKAKLTGEEAFHEFTLNRNVSKMAIRIEFPADANFRINILKGSVDLTHLASKIINERYQHLTFKFPERDKNGIYRSEGIWKIKISGQDGSAYRIALIVDDHYLDYNCNVDKTLYTVGDTIKMSVDLAYKGKALLDPSNKIKAIVFKPGDDIGDLLARTEAGISRDTTDVSTAAQQKLVNLLNDTAFCNALRAEEQLIDMVMTDSGIYSGSFYSTEFTGIYSIIFFLDGVIPGNGSFERLEAKDILFKFGQLDPAATEVTVTPDPGSSQATVNIRPINKFGKYLGPGFHNQIKIDVGDCKKFWNPTWTMLKQTGSADKPDNLQKGLGLIMTEDHLNGGYSVVLNNIPEKSDPVLRITVMGEVLRQGKLSQLCKTDSNENLWTYVISAILFIILLLVYFIKKGGITRLPKWIIWLFVIVWIIILILQKMGLLNIIGSSCY